MLRKSLILDGHETTVTVSDAGPDGWEVREERDSEIVRQVRYTDWHRVERAVMRFSAESQDNPDTHSTNR
jgi:hypothetical protein